MINLNFNIRIDDSLLPEKLRNHSAKVLFGRHGILFKNKAWEIEIIGWYPNPIFEFFLDLRWRGRDHAGPRFEIGMLGFSINLMFSDRRHWNYDENRWETYEEGAAYEN